MWVDGVLWVFGALAAIGGITGIWKIATSMSEFKSTIDTFKKESVKTDEELKDTLNKLSNKIHTELSYNGGSSIKDAVARIDTQLLSIGVHLKVSTEFDKRGIFFCDYNGNNINVNQTYANVLGCTKEELEGRGWENFILDLQLYESSWNKAISHKRHRFEHLLTFVSKTNKHIQGKIVCVHAYELSGYIGYIIWNKDDTND